MISNDVYGPSMYLQKHETLNSEDDFFEFEKYDSPGKHFFPL